MRYTEEQKREKEAYWIDVWKNFDPHAPCKSLGEVIAEEYDIPLTLNLLDIAENKLQHGRERHNHKGA